MVKDPYSVLGLTKEAGADEIKSAYRKMAKKYHPDLHPDDPNAANKMNEINEAYDMLTHPEKYAARRAYEEQAQNARNAYGYGQSGYGNHSYGGASGGYRGAGGWYTNFDGFDFEDFFGFGRYSENTSYNFNPTHDSSDTIEMSRAVDLINSGRYADAIQLLMQVIQRNRNARWYYLNAVALYGYGDASSASEYILRASQMEPDNELYVALLRKLRQEGQTYYRTTATVINPFRMVGRIFLFIIAFRFILGLLGYFLGGMLFLPM